VKLEENASDIYAMLSEAYGGDTMKKAYVFEWDKWFKGGHESKEDDERRCYLRSHRTDENVVKVWNLMHSDRCSSFRAMAVQLNLDKYWKKA